MKQNQKIEKIQDKTKAQPTANLDEKKKAWRPKLGSKLENRRSKAGGRSAG